MSSKPLDFVKYQGAGNDFILVDDRSHTFPIHEERLIQRLCHRQLGIGADGLILLQTSSVADFRMRIFNADGREPSMCGNGIRCLLHFIRHLGFGENGCSIETKQAILPCHFLGDNISVGMGKPKVLHQALSLEIEKESFLLDVVDTGVPHAVIFVPKLETIDLATLGKKIRHHPLFAPDGVNVNFAESLSEGTLRVRTYERGVEGETLACGTGSGSVAFVASQSKVLPSPIRIKTLSGEMLEFILSADQELQMIGPACLVFEGRIGI